MKLIRPNLIIFLLGLGLVVLLFVPMNNKPKMSLEFKKQGKASILDTSGQVLASFEVEIADTPEKQEQGLMKRTKMENDQAMLFLMDELEVHNFWMEETYLSLDILFADSLKEVVFIAKATEPESQEPISSLTPCLYVLETKAGICDKYGIRVGHKLEFERLESE